MRTGKNRELAGDAVVVGTALLSGGLAAAGLRSLATNGGMRLVAGNLSKLLEEKTGTTLGRLGLAGSALFAGSAAQEAVLGHDKNAFTDLALSVAFLGNGAAAFGRAIPAKAAAWLGRPLHPAVAEFAGKAAVADALLPTGARGVEKATGQRVHRTSLQHAGHRPDRGFLRPQP